MDTLTALLAQIGETLGALDRLWLDRLGFLRLREALVAAGMLGLLALAVIVARAGRGERPGRYRIALPALLPRTPRVGRGFVRHAPFLLFLAGLPLFVIALAAPHVSLVKEETTYPGHRITILIDASLSMNSAFSTRQLRAGNTFLANVSAAEYFVKRRMDGPYHDLVALIEFGSQAYIVTPFTNDYENILLSIGLIGTPEEYRRFPDHGTLIMGAINRGVQLFRTVRLPRRHRKPDRHLQRRPGYPRGCTKISRWTTSSGRRRRTRFPCTSSAPATTSSSATSCRTRSGRTRSKVPAGGSFRPPTRK